VYGIQARRLRETIDKMDSIAKDQGADMKAYIAEATRSATSMESISAALNANVKQIEDTLKTNREIAETTLKNIRLAYTPHVSVAPKFFHCLGQPDDRPRDYMLTIGIVNSGGIHARALEAVASCVVVNGAAQSHAKEQAQTLAPGAEFVLQMKLPLGSGEIDTVESRGITVDTWVSVWLNHDIDGPFQTTFSQTVFCSPGKNPVLVRTTDYFGAP